MRRSRSRVSRDGYIDSSSSFSGKEVEEMNDMVPQLDSYEDSTIVEHEGQEYRVSMERFSAKGARKRFYYISVFPHNGSNTVDDPLYHALLPNKKKAKSVYGRVIRAIRRGGIEAAFHT